MSIPDADSRFQNAKYGLKVSNEGTLHSSCLGLKIDIMKRQETGGLSGHLVIQFLLDMTPLLAQSASHTQLHTI